MILRGFLKINLCDALSACWQVKRRVVMCPVRLFSILVMGVWVIKHSFSTNFVSIAVCGVPFSGSEGALGGFLKFLNR